MTTAAEQLKHITDLHTAVHDNVEYRNPSLSYDEIVTQAIELCNAAHAYARDDGTTSELFELWTIGEHTISLDNVIVGLYWHAYEWHGGQNSDTYALLCAAGQVYTPNMANGPEPESSEEDFYKSLNALAEKQ